MGSVFVVICSSGEYSDRVEWVAGVYTDKEEAIRITTEMMSVSKAADVEYDLWCRKQSAIFRRFNNGRPQHWNEPITAEVQSVIDAEIGREPPKGGSIDDYYITEAPLDQWGRWEGMLGE